MVGTSALVPIIVAVIGLVGAIVPIYANIGVLSQPNVRVGILDSVLDTPGYVFRIENEGNAPATNLSIFFSGCTPNSECLFNIHSITNHYSTANIILPHYNNTPLELGATKFINGSIAEIQTSKLVQGPASFIELIVTYINHTGHIEIPADPVAYAVYDQGSGLISYSFGPEGENLAISAVVSTYNLYKEYVEPLVVFYAIFYPTLFGLVYLYLKRRKAPKRIMSNLTDNILEIREALRNDSMNKGSFPDVWFDIPSKKRRRFVKDITDYLMIDDFFSELRKRNVYISKDKNEESDLSKNITLSKINETVLSAAENVLNKVDWNKYR